MNTAAQETYISGKTLYRRSQSGFYFPDTCSAEQKNAIAYAHSARLRVRIFQGDTATGEAWADEWGVTGTIGRSTGPCKIPLLICNARSIGGGGLLSDCIVAMFNTRTGHAVYKHPSFNPGVWNVIPATGDLRDAGYCEIATHNGIEHASFKKPGQGARYCAFMRGERFSK
jgi:hypothetical protein